ncbi:hypothetical protein CKAH01_06188 [Colletotrichum kahawae]|uniref:Uncharacterized protein n=1 Tax=Colletotrichum kahawae TaxID=34407 RepID=A0AAD9YAY4_COLKA|nr:hypothetical protein CKAH01_06188 [Colletotrichum kahawae]
MDGGAFTGLSDAKLDGGDTAEHRTQSTTPAVLPLEHSMVECEHRLDILTLNGPNHVFKLLLASNFHASNHASPHQGSEECRILPSLSLSAYFDDMVATKTSRDVVAITEAPTARVNWMANIDRHFLASIAVARETGERRADESLIDRFNAHTNTGDTGVMEY